MIVERPKRRLKNSRVLIGSAKRLEVEDMPNLIENQLSSYEWFLQRKAKQTGAEIKNQGLEALFREIFPIYNADETMSLEYEEYILSDESKYDEFTSKQKGTSYEISLKVVLNLCQNGGSKVRSKEIYLGELPLMTERGTFIINGAERVIVSQIHRSPGVVYSIDDKTKVLNCRIIPYRGSWLEFEIDEKKNLVYVRIDRKRKILVTTYLRVLGFNTREKIIALFYNDKTIKIDTVESQEAATGEISFKDIYALNPDENGYVEKLVQAGTRLSNIDIDKLVHAGITEIPVINETIIKLKVDDEDGERLKAARENRVIINCFEKEEVIPSKDEPYKDEPSQTDAISKIINVIKQGEPISVENAEKEIKSMYFSDKRYVLGAVGRYKLNKKFDFDESNVNNALSEEDIIEAIRYLIMVHTKLGHVNDVDHLGNRRIRSVGELLKNALDTAFKRVERIAKERMNTKDAENMKPSDFISVKPINSAISEFFGSSQLSQFMDQVNPLSELTHKRRLSALGSGGLSRDRAGFEVRDVHYTHYGKMCPIETPEGPNIGLIVSLCNFAKINDFGFLMTPYKKVVNGKVTDQMEYLTALDEDKHFIAQASSPVDADGNFLEEQISVMKQGDYSTKNAKEIDYIDYSPRQIISSSTSLVPFLEHDDANRALMGSNMQRQAVPLLLPEAPYVGTGMEEVVAYDSGVCIISKFAGTVDYVTALEVLVRRDENNEIVDRYPLLKNKRTNQDTCFNQRPIVKKGQHVEAGEVIADGPACDHGELALGKNVLVAYMPWNGYNYEDAIILSERVVKEDVFTSVHIKEFSVDVRETKLGPEKITRDIPNVSENKLRNLDEDGIIRVGSKVKAQDILVGKVTPKSDVEASAEYKLLHSIFGEKAKDVKDSSLKLPHGVEGTVIEVLRQRKDFGDDELSPGVEEVVKVYVANKRKIKVGDKMAGRHGNKGVVSIVLPIEDMPYLADGTPVDIVLNPLGVPSRMNIGQIMETQLGLAAKALGVKFASCVFESATAEQISGKLKEAGQPENSKFDLYDGRTGEKFVNPVTVGVTYMLKLAHMVDDKMHARSTGPYSLVTQQPLGGKAQFGGQRLGEMEVWALYSYGAAHTLQELMTVKSDDMNGRTKMYDNIVKGEYSSAPGIPESFNVLVQELKGLALDMKIYDSRGKIVPLTEKEQAILDSSIEHF